MSGITHSQTQDSGTRTLAVIAAIVVAFAIAAAVALALGDGGSATTPASEPATNVAPASVTNSGVRYDGGPEEGSWSIAPNPGRPDGGPEEGTRGPGH